MARTANGSGSCVREIFSHSGSGDTFEEISSQLFMSSKNRPLWDLQYLMELGFTRVYGIPDIRRVMTGREEEDELSREMRAFMPMFLAGGEK